MYANGSLVDSRALRIVWLLEELQLDYEIKVYPRGADLMAPPELKKVSPMGLSPILEVVKEGKLLTVLESGHIAQYLVQHYDKAGKLAPRLEDDAELVDYYLHFAEGSLQWHLVALLVGTVAVQRAPWGTKSLVKFIVGKVNLEYYLKRLFSALHFLDSQLEKKGGGYFVGDSLTAADIILDFPINQNVFVDAKPIMGPAFDPAKQFPNLYKWHLLTTKEPGRARAVDAEKRAIAVE